MKAVVLLIGFEFLYDMDKRRRIVVIGGGFAGMNFVKRIDKTRYAVTLVDCNNYHSFPPLFYQIASSGLEPDSICFPFRRELHRGKAHGAEFHLGCVEWIDAQSRKVKTQFETIDYDFLVIAAGTTNNFFGNDDLIKKVYTLKSTAQAMRCRDEILDRLERAAICDDIERRRKLLSFTVVGGGPAGVEIAGALGEMKRYILHRNYPTIPPEDVTITLIEGSDTLLGAMGEKSQADALKYLRELMVDVRFGLQVRNYSDNMVSLSDGTDFYSGMVIWTAGIAGVDLEFRNAGFKPVRGRRIAVDRFNRVIGLGNDDVYAIGDIAMMAAPGYPDGHPQLAQVAIQQGRLLAHNLNSGSAFIEFSYHDKGTMATIGRNRAVADIRHMHLSGFVAWLVWMFVHLISILGMRNKISVLIDWTWNYFSYSTSLRLLLNPSRFPLKNRKE